MPAHRIYRPQPNPTQKSRDEVNKSAASCDEPAIMTAFKVHAREHLGRASAEHAGTAMTRAFM